jgi:hypothetical protein
VTRAASIECRSLPHMFQVRDTAGPAAHGGHTVSVAFKAASAALSRRANRVVATAGVA